MLTKHFNFQGNKANTEQTNPDFLFAVNTKYATAIMPKTAAIIPIMLDFLTNVQSKEPGSHGASIPHMVTLKIGTLTVDEQWL